MRTATMASGAARGNSIRAPFRSLQERCRQTFSVPVLEEKEVCLSKAWLIHLPDTLGSNYWMSVVVACLHEEYVPIRITAFKILIMVLERQIRETSSEALQDDSRELLAEAQRLLQLLHIEEECS